MMHSCHLCEFLARTSYIRSEENSNNGAKYVPERSEVVTENNGNGKQLRNILEKQLKAHDHSVTKLGATVYHYDPEVSTFGPACGLILIRWISAYIECCRVVPTFSLSLKFEQ